LQYSINFFAEMCAAAMSRRRHPIFVTPHAAEYKSA
jgi:hypothetical protein